MDKLHQPREEHRFFGFQGLGFGERGLGWGVAEPSNSPEEKDTRVKQVVLVIALFALMSAIIVIALVGWRHLPEVLADWIGTIVGIMSTPFFLEASFIFIGLCIVVAINHWRQKRAGDDFVEIEVNDNEE